MSGAVEGLRPELLLEEEQEGRVEAALPEGQREQGCAGLQGGLRVLVCPGSAGLPGHWGPERVYEWWEMTDLRRAVSWGQVVDSVDSGEPSNTSKQGSGLSFIF